LILYSLFNSITDEFVNTIGNNFHFLQAEAHPGGLFGYHDRPLCIAGKLLSTKGDNKIANAVTTGL